MNHGLIVKPIEEDHYVFGDAKLGDAPINPGGQWDPYLPVPEDQNLGGFEPMACTTFALLNVVETMIRQKYGQSENLCKRFLAYASGTTHSGNDPHTVAETLRTKGNVDEADYPFTPSINSWELFYVKPAQWLYTKALEFIARYSFGHSWVSPINPANMRAALEYSPLTAGVYAWQQDGTTGYYVNPQNLQPEHDVEVYGYVENQYWKIFDSYSQEAKKLVWNFPFVAVKRYTLNAQVVNPTAWTSFLNWMQQIIDQLKGKLGFGDYVAAKLGGATRSSKWPAARAAYLKKNPACELCGGTTRTTVHHIHPVHLFPQYELLERLPDGTRNYITLCEGKKQLNCHLILGHADNFRTKWNPSVVADVEQWRTRIVAKQESEAFPEKKE